MARASADSPVLAKLCGDGIPPPIQSIPPLFLPRLRSASFSLFSQPLRLQSSLFVGPSFACPSCVSQSAVSLRHTGYYFARMAERHWSSVNSAAAAAWRWRTDGRTRTHRLRARVGEIAESLAARRRERRRQCNGDDGAKDGHIGRHRVGRTEPLHKL